MLDRLVRLLSLNKHPCKRCSWTISLHGTMLQGCNETGRWAVFRCNQCGSTRLIEEPVSVDSPPNGHQPAS